MSGLRDTFDSCCCGDGPGQSHSSAEPILPGEGWVTPASASGSASVPASTWLCGSFSQDSKKIKKVPKKGKSQQLPLRTGTEPKGP